MALQASVSSRRLLVLGLLIVALSLIKAVEAYPGLPPNFGLSQLNRSSFPNGFLFGAATSAFQNEGGVGEDLKGRSIWDTYTQKYPEKISDRSNASIATDSYHRYKEDVRLVKQMGLDVYRFSISWSRVLPLGRRSGGINELGIAYYNNLINELHSNGIEPFVTLFHWDLPQALEDEYGGFLSSRIVNDYTEFAELCFRRFGDRVKYWITFNEPWSFSVGGYEAGFLAPGRCSVYVANCTGGDSSIEPYIVTHNQLLAHAAAVKLYRAKYQGPQNGQIGITLVTRWFVPYSEVRVDRDAAFRALDFNFGWFMNPLTNGDYPRSMRNNVGERLPQFSLEESYMLRNSYDFLGLNYYTATYVKHADQPVTANMTHTSDSQTNATYVKNGVSIGPPAGADWLRVYPQGLHDLLLYIKGNYNNPPIYITENGINEVNNVTTPVSTTRQDGVLKDDFRVRYYQSHLTSLQQAISEGVDVKGFIAWALMDNFEWNSGYSVRFGLNFVDYHDNCKRYPKFSATWFTNFLRIRK